MIRVLARTALPLGLIALMPMSCGGDDSRTFVEDTGGTGGTAGGSAGTAGTGGTSGSGGSSGADASAGTGGGDAGKTCSGASDCDDGLACNGVETCEGNLCKAGTNLKDGTACDLSIDGGVGDSGITFSCVSGECRAVCKDDTDCDDNDVCTGKEICNPTTKTCQSGTPLDCDDTNDCTTNECDAVKGCYNPLIDQDKDGHAATSLGSCGDDCNDNEKTIYKGAPELCDGKDNDCDGKVDGSEPTWYADCDKDGFAPAGATAIKVCTKPTTPPTSCSGGGWTEKAPGPGTTDCFDTNAAVHPMTAAESNAAWTSSAIPGATTAVDFDYNCDGTEEKRFTKSFVPTNSSCANVVSPPGCTGLCALVCTGAAGYSGAVPACGDTGTYSSCAKQILGCKRVITTAKAQECR